MIFDNQYELQRIEKANQLKELGHQPYPHNITKDTTTAEFKEKFSEVTDRDESQNATLSGRIKFLRIMGKAAFVK
ncbi:MAG TPA: lysine--tRNA ligase, partial [Campylobacterales bacterium]|nr:lysine--tRNA ligase [Campylobacterales bacterium]